jgi:hypothetical protein
MKTINLVDKMAWPSPDDPELVGGAVRRSAGPLAAGGDGDLTDVVCGYLHSPDPLFDPGLRVCPPVFVVRPPPGPAAESVRANVACALERADRAPLGQGSVRSRLPELLLMEVLRLHLASAPAADHGLLAALADPVLRPAMSLLHTRRRPPRRLRGGAGFSRAFRRTHGESPSAWRSGHALR